MQNVNPDLQPYLKELEDRMKKPLTEQIEDLKIAGAKFLQSIDKLIASVDDFDPDQVTCSVDDKKVDCDTWGETDYAECVDHLVDSMEQKTK